MKNEIKTTTNNMLLNILCSKDELNFGSIHYLSFRERGNMDRLLVPLLLSDIMLSSPSIIVLHILSNSAFNTTFDWEVLCL